MNVAKAGDGRCDQGITMYKVLSILGFLAGFGLLAAFFFNPGAVDSSQARESMNGCRTVEVAVDEGYGVSATAPRLVCAQRR